MKKIAFSFTLLLTLTFTAFAEGDINIGAKTCSPNQTCLFELNQNETDNPIISAVKGFLALLF